ncbi:MAG TPA: glycerate kinase [Chloroflexi bacterium]|nr:glycerate kinase [Chloroflexota bacterium]
MKNTAHQIIQAALKAVDPYQAVLSHLTREGDTLGCGEKSYALSNFERARVIGFGKGSAPMARAVHALLADRINDGLVIVKYGHTGAGERVSRGERGQGSSGTGFPACITLAEAGHPTPDENSVRYTNRLVSMLRGGNARDLLICVTSGGGSALLTLPAEGVSLADVQLLTQMLLEVGATINEINTARKHLSQVKGGRLAQLAQPATLLNLILSDVGGDPLDTIASGPTAPDPSTFADALAILEKYRLTKRAPSSILAHLQAGIAGKQPETPKVGDPAFENVQNQIVANNRIALDAAAQKAREMGWTALALPAFIEGEARDVAREFVLAAASSRQYAVSSKEKTTKDEGWRAKLLSTFRPPSFVFRPVKTATPTVFMWGGETTVTIRGEGLGGRNQEMALAAAIELSGQKNTLAAFFATDGNDGATDAAGAFADGETIARGAAIDLNAQSYLNSNDSYHFFQAIDDLIITGPTNTNVNDIALLLVC